MLFTFSSTPLGLKRPLPSAWLSQRRQRALSTYGQGNVDAAKVLFSAQIATPMDVDDLDGSSYLAVRSLMATKGDLRVIRDIIVCLYV